jgi:hypothetical protein
MLASRSECIREQLLMRYRKLAHSLAQLLDGIRQAHLGLGQAAVDGYGVLDARVVAAGPAVELVLGFDFAHAREDRRHLVAGRLRDALIVDTEAPGQVEIREAGDVQPPLFFAIRRPVLLHVTSHEAAPAE